MDIRCSRDGTNCNACPIMKECEKAELTEEVDLWLIYNKALDDISEKMKLQYKNYKSMPSIHLFLEIVRDMKHD